MTLKTYIIDKSHRGTRQEMRTVRRNGKVFQRNQWVGRKPKILNYILPELKPFADEAKKYKTSTDFKNFLIKLKNEGEIPQEAIDLINNGYNEGLKNDNEGFENFYKLATKENKSKIPTWAKVGTALILVAVFLVTILAPTAQAIQGRGAMSEIEDILKRGAEENEKDLGLANQRLHFKDLGFETEMEAKIHLNNTIENLSIKNESLGSNWSYNDKVMFSNFVKLANDDITQTYLSLNTAKPTVIPTIDLTDPNNPKLALNESADKTYFNPLTGKYLTSSGVENNPAVRPFVHDINTFRAAGLIGQVYLADRWSKMENSQQRTMEMVFANLIEAWCLKDGQTPWRVQFGVEFNV